MTTTRAYYNKFDRHDHGIGLKGHSTHYCPGCGHGLIHNFIAESIVKLGVQDRTIAVSPVGCSVFLHYYLDVGNTQAAHGRASVVALGHKLANPKSVVISYQGDGDLASIGLAEIMHTAQLGIPIAVIFVNNAIYGMTGGQLAPTTLMNQKTQTSPNGRSRLNGEPMKVAEMMANLDGPIYVERVALFDSVQRRKAKKAIEKAIEMQANNSGFAFIEVLAECPTHLKMTPLETEKWVKEEMLPIFPLGIKKQTNPNNPWFKPQNPNFHPETVIEILGGKNEKIQQFSEGIFPSHIDANDISLKLAGSGGDGAQTAAMLITQAAINENFDATHIPSYGPESRGGTSYADVHIAKTKVLSPSSPHPKILIAFNTPSLIKFAPTVSDCGIILYDSSIISQDLSKELSKLDPSIKVYGVPFAETATKLGKTFVKNIVALGALNAAAKLFPDQTFLNTLKRALGGKTELLPLNEAAYAAGKSFK